MQTRLYTLLAIAGLAFSFTANAKIWRLNNNGAGTLPLIAADFPSSTTLQQAHDNASVLSGDTIHLEQSPTSYGNCTFTKRLVVIGSGYFLDLNPKTQVNKDYGSIVGQLILQNAGSAGSVITGLTQNAGSAWYVGANNVTIARNYFPYAAGARIYVGTGTASSSDGINIYQNYMSGSSNTYTIQTAPGTTGNITNLSIIGNIIGGAYGIAFGSNANGIVKNNTILITTYALSLYNFYVVNNISYSSGNGANAFYNCNIEFNMGSHNNQFVSPNGTGNTFGSGNFTQAYSVANWGFVGGTSTDGYYQLQSSSPAKTAGKSGEEMGAYGSSIPYKLSGIPSVPNIYSMTIGTISAGASSISVTVSAKSNN